MSRYIINKDILVVHEGLSNNKDLADEINDVINKLINITHDDTSHLADVALCVGYAKDNLGEICTKIFERFKTEKLVLTVETPEDHILIAEGVMFDGSRDQFGNCYFDNSSNENIINWCKENDCSLEINKIKILCV